MAATEFRVRCRVVGAAISPRVNDEEARTDAPLGNRDSIDDCSSIKKGRLRNGIVHFMF